MRGVWTREETDVREENLLNERLRDDAEAIVKAAIAAVGPEKAVHRALQGRRFSGRLYMVAVGKAAWRMARAAADCLDRPPEAGIVITKYGHVPGSISGVTCFEAGHPIPDENSFRATEAVLEMTRALQADDTVLFLLSGGGSALFEKPLLDATELQEITAQLLACGAAVAEINTIRKRLSAVKGGRFAEWCAPARVEAVVLSDVLGDAPDAIASGPTVSDGSTCAEAMEIARKYRLKLSEDAWGLLRRETPKSLQNSKYRIVGSVRELCRAAASAAESLGYEPVLLTDHLDCQARHAGVFLADILKTHAADGRRLAYLAGGETVVQLTGNGLGGRNQELALAAAERIEGIPGVCVISVGSDGTDGPTDAAGGYADGDTCRTLAGRGVRIAEVLAENDAYHALRDVDGLVFTGPTGTNVNDIAVALISG